MKTSQSSDQSIVKEDEHVPKTNLEIMCGFNKQGDRVLTESRTSLLAYIRKEFLKTGKTPLAVPVFYLMLMNSQGQLYVQQRSHLAAEDQGLYDVTVKGHVHANESYDEALRREAIEELGIAVTIAHTDDYHYRVDKVGMIDGLDKKAVVKRISWDTWRLAVVKTDGQTWEKRWRAAIYMGRYDGDVTFNDGEVCDCKKHPIGELIERMQIAPQLYTADLKSMIHDYKRLLKVDE